MSNNTPLTNVTTISADDIMEGIREWVSVETPTYEAEQVNMLVDVVQQGLERAGLTSERILGRDGYGDILICRSTGAENTPGILVLSHLDTVHPMGSIEGKLKFRQEDDKIYGPGIYDMKGGAYVAQYAYRHLVQNGIDTKLPVTFLYVPEEEVGSPTSREIIEEIASKNKYVLVTEPARDGGKVVSSRKGVIRFDIEVQGRPAHSGSRHMDGRSAIKEMAKQILRLEELTDYDRGVLCNVGSIKGGTAINVVPEFCSVEVDMRVDNAELEKEMCELVLGFQSFDPDVSITITGGANRPAYEFTEANQDLFNKAAIFARAAGFELEHTHTGGGSDGNYTAAMGIATLDGLGLDGAGAHTRGEHVFYSSIIPRTNMWIHMLQSLE